MEAIKGLSNDKIELIILEIQERPILWNKADKNYRDCDVKEVIWNKIGEDVDLPGKRVSKIWCNLRDTRTRYIREDKKTLSSGAGQIKGKMDGWKWAKPLEFLSTADYPRSTVSNIQPSQTLGEEEEEEEAEAEMIHFNDEVESNTEVVSQKSQETPSSTPPITTPKRAGQVTPGRRTKKSKSTDELETVYMSYLKDKQIALKDKEKEKDLQKDLQNDADRQWLLSLLPNFQGMSLRKKNLIKYKIQGLFLEEDENTSNKGASNFPINYQNQQQTYHQPPQQQQPPQQPYQPFPNSMSAQNMHMDQAHQGNHQNQQNMQQEQFSYGQHQSFQEQLLN